MKSLLNLFVVAVCGFIFDVGLASYCGQAGVPFSLEVLPNGQPVLGCARPTCFGWNANGTRSADVAQFYTIGKKPDGFFRKIDFKGPIIKNITNFQPQFSYCDRGYLSTTCSKSQWVGGIAPLGMINASTNFLLMCCTYSKLSTATDESPAKIRGGQSVVGGEVRGENGQQVSFEYIANMGRNFDSRGVFYTVILRRFSCPELIESPIPSAENMSVDTTTTLSLPEKGSQTLENINSKNSQTKPNFDATKFDLPKDMPQEDTTKVGEFRGRKAAGEKTFSAPDGPKVSDIQDNIKGPYIQEQSQLVQSGSQFPQLAAQPYQIGSQVYQANQQPPLSNAYQPSLLDSLGIFSPRGGLISGVQNPQQPPQPQPQPIIQRVPTVGINGQWYAQPGPYITQVQYNSKGVPLGTVFPGHSQSFPVAHAAPSAQQSAPLKVPSVEEVENAIPAASRKILTHVANAFLNKKIK